MDDDEMVEILTDWEEAQNARDRRDAGLSPAERLERVHELCRQLAAIKPASPRE